MTAAMTRTLPAILVFLCATAHAVNLNNWRFPYYQLATELDMVRTSPSGMFYDDLQGCAPFGTRLWPDSAGYSANHWALEPAGGVDLSTDKGIDGKTYRAGGQVLSDITYRHLSTRQVLNFDTRSAGDSTYPWTNDRAIAGRIDEAYLQATWKYGMLRIGRLNRNWGPFADRSLLLSANPYSYDGLEWQVFCTVFEYRHLFAAFPRQTSNLDTDGATHTGRYLTAHSLNVILGRWAALGITETVLFARSEGLPDLQYVNPMSIYFATNTNGEGGGNLMLGLAGWVHPCTERVKLSGQLIIDDFQFDNKTAGDQEPNHWGVDVGGTLKDPLPVKGVRSLVSLEYRYLSRRLYTVNVDNADIGENYVYMQRSLGAETTDGDRVRGAFTVLGRDFWLARIGLGLTRAGGNTATTRWSTEPRWTGPGLGYRKETSLSKRDNVERTIELSLEGRGYFRDFADGYVRLSNRWIENKGNGASAYRYDPAFGFGLTVHYCRLFLRLPK